jgi:uncharacterized membrane protein
MKKIYALLILFFILLPIKVDAYGIEKYFMDVDVLENGDIHVKEIFLLNGEFNGYDRVIDYKGNDMPFNGSLESFEQSSIYNGSSIQLIAIKDIPKPAELTRDNMNDYGQVFEQNNFANIGSTGFYSKTSDSSGDTYRIFNKSDGLGKIFFIEYIIKDVVVIHNDVAELYFNIFSDKQNESIKVFEANINLPNNSKELRAWAHGPLYGDVDLISSKNVRVKIDGLEANTPLDYRIVFDKSLVSRSVKYSNVDALDKVLEVEQKRADDANEIREELKGEYNNLLIINIAWVLMMVFYIAYIYNKYDKELSNPLKTKYYRDFPASYGPEVVSFLFDKGIETQDLSASLLNLIANKVVTHEERGKDKFTLIYKNKDIKVTKAEEKLLKWFFSEIGKNDEVTIEDINKASKNYDKFLKNYEQWKQIVKEEAKNENFFEKEDFKFRSSLLPLTGFIIAYFSNIKFIMPVATFIVLAMAIGSFIYILTIYKRTPKGNVDYNNWRGLKNFLNDFGQFDHRDLPHVSLWEKYLVYAMVFGLASKLSKTMAIKFKEISQQGNLDIVDLYYINRLTSINHSINRSVSSAVTSAYNTKVAHSRSSSGSGFGGGFSGGGGFGGGGGGGGRF